jgi:2-methylcitrate dehydratase PrpD
MTVADDQHPYTSRLADFACSLEYDDIPGDVVAHVKRIFLNLTAATLWGWRTRGGQQVHQVMRTLGGQPEATVMASTNKLPAVYAAAVHASLAFATMTDDTHGPAQIHSGHASIPSALAEGELAGASGRDVIAAIVAANEVGIRIAHSVGPEQSQTHNTMQMGFWGELKAGFCALVASGRLIGLTSEQMAHGIGIAATSSSGVLATGYALPPHATQCGTIFAWDAGKAVLMGGLAARLAKAGMTSGPAPLEGPRGWIKTYTGGHGRPASLLEHLGDVFETGSISLKTHCMSHTIFPLIDAAYRIATSHRLDCGNIKKIIVTGPPYIASMLWRTKVVSFEDAVCSAPFPIVLNLIAPESITLPGKVMDYVGHPLVNALLERVEFEPDPSTAFNAGPLPGKLRVVTGDGQIIEEVANSAVKGVYPDHPLRPEEIDHKLSQAADGLIETKQVRRFIDLVSSLEEQERIEELMACLRPAA